MSITDINQEFGDGLGEYLYDQFHNDLAGVNRGGTDINAALRMAYDVYQEDNRPATCRRGGFRTW